MGAALDRPEDAVPLTEDDFLTRLAVDGFLEVERKTIAGGTALGEHQHAWDARLYVVEGRLVLGEGASVRAYEAGEVLEVPRERVHTEHYDAGDTRLIIGRRR